MTVLTEYRCNMGRIVIENRYKLLISAAGFFIAALPRFMAAQGDLWLDEIWSLYLLKNAVHLWDVLGIYHDNNHILNSLYLFLGGENSSIFSYRLLSVLSGSIAVAVMGFINLHRGCAAGLITMALGAFSYPLIHYSSEARGYASAMLFALASYVFLKKTISKSSRWSITLFQASVILGMLSHLTFIFVYVSLLAWTMANQIRSGVGLRHLTTRMIFWNLAPVSVIFALYLFFVRRMVIGGGDPGSLDDVLISLAILISGALEVRLAEIIGIMLTCIGLAGSLMFLQREGDDEWGFFLCVVILVPLFFFATTKPGFIDVRYFMMGLPFYYLMAGRWMAAILRGSAASKTICIFVFLFFLAGNVQRTIDLITVGRGGYRKAVEFMAAQTSGSDIRVSSDTDFRNKMVLQYYSQYLPPGKRLLYFDRNRYPVGGPEWVITHSQKDDFKPPREIEIPNSGKYFISGLFPYRGLSGWHWVLYRQQSKTTK